MPCAEELIVLSSQKRWSRYLVAIAVTKAEIAISISKILSSFTLPRKIIKMPIQKLYQRLLLIFCWYFRQSRYWVTVRKITFIVLFVRMCRPQPFFEGTQSYVYAPQKQVWLPPFNFSWLAKRLDGTVSSGTVFTLIFILIFCFLTVSAVTALPRLEVFICFICKCSCANSYGPAWANVFPTTSLMRLPVGRGHATFPF